MVIVYNLTLIGIAAGLGVDHLMLAFHNGNNTKLSWQLPLLKRSRRPVSPNWIIVSVLPFLMENMVLVCGIAFGIIMFHEIEIKNRVSFLRTLNIRLCIESILGTSVYIFAFSCAMPWLKIDHSKIQLIFLLFLIFTKLSGIVLDRYHFNKTFRYLNKISPLMIIAGSLLLTLQYMKNIL